jgi:hypothetical protein
VADVIVPDGRAGPTPQWLTHALDRGVELGGASVVDVTVTPVSTGQMCDGVRIELRYGRPDRAMTIAGGTSEPRQPGR